MRIPKGIFKIGKMAGKEGVMSGVMVMRTGEDAGQVMVTAGRCAVRVKFTEPPSDRLPGMGEAEKVVDGFMQVIPAEAAMDADGIAEKDPGYVAIDETAPDLHELSNTSETPLFNMPYGKLCPGSAALDRLQKAFR